MGDFNNHFKLISGAFFTIPVDLYGTLLVTNGSYYSFLSRSNVISIIAFYQEALLKA